MSSEEQDLKAKEAARNKSAPRASKPGAVAVAAEEAARLDQRIADKREQAGASLNQSSNDDVLAKQRGVRGTATPTKPGAYAESSSSAATQLGNLERDVAAKIRSSTAATQPGAHAMVNDGSMEAKVNRSTPGAQAVASSNNDPVSAKIRREGITTEAYAELANLENAVVSKVRAVPAATTPGAVASLQGMEDSIAAKVRRIDNDGSLAPGAQAHLQTVEDSIAAKIRRETSSSSSSNVGPGAQARLQNIEDSVAAKIRRDNATTHTTSVTPALVGELRAVEDSVAAKIRGSNVTATAVDPTARAELGNLEDAIAHKIVRESGTMGARAELNTMGARAELNNLESSLATKVQATNPSSGALGEVNRLEYTVSNELDGQPRSNGSSLVEDELNRFESAVRSKENISINGVENVTSKVLGMTDDLDKIKLDSRPEQALDKDDDRMPQGTQDVATTADRGVAVSPDLEYGTMGVAAGEGLAVAVAVEEEEEDMFIPSAVEYDPDAKPPMYKNRRFRLYAFLAFFIIVVVVIGATIAATFGKSHSTPAPTAAPTTYRESFGLESSVQRVFGEDGLLDPESPYAKALEWMTNEDPMELVPSEDPNFIQRYTAVYLYYATTEQGPWRSCNPPQNPRTDPTECTFKKLAFLFPEKYDDQPSHAWLSNTHECDWAGILCDDQKQIRSIDLSGGSLTGTFPEGVYNFPFLQELSLFWNNITGPLPDKLTEMDHLVSLELHYNKFTGSVPQEWWQARNLQRINIGENMITGSIPTEVANLRDIKGFFVMTNLLTGKIPEEIGVLDSVTYFRASRNQLEGELPSTFTNLKNVAEVWLHRNLVNGTIPEDIGKLALLGDLRLHVNPMSGELPESLWDLDLLWRLELYECNFTGTLSESIGKLGKGFYELHISDNMFEGPLPQNMSALVELYSVWIQGNDFTGAVPQELCDQKGNSIAQMLVEFQADCASDSSGFIELTCPTECCSSCCKPDGSDCLSTTSNT